MNAPHSVKSGNVTYAAGAFDTLELTNTSGSLANDMLTVAIPDVSGLATVSQLNAGLAGKIDDVLAGTGLVASATNGTRTLSLNTSLLGHDIKSGGTTYSASSFDTLELTSTTGAVAGNVLTLTLPDPYTKQETQHS